MPRTMYDSVSAAAIPADAAMIGGYVDGPESKWSDADWQRFPNAVKVRIAVNPATDDGHVLDVEKGNWPSADAVPWIVKRRAAGVVPTVYGNNGVAGYRLTEVTAACVAQGVAPPQYWFANWGAPAVLPDGYVALQYANGDAYDTSIVADYWPGVDPEPVPPAPNVPDIVDAQTDIANARALVTQADILLEHAQEDLNTVTTNAPPIPKPEPTVSEMLAAIDSIASGVNMLLLETVPTPTRNGSFIAPTWLPLLLSVALVVVQQALSLVGTLPKSTPVTVTLLVLTILASSIPAIEALLAGHGAQQLTMQREAQAHERAMAIDIRRQYIGKDEYFTPSSPHQAAGLA